MKNYYLFTVKDEHLMPLYNNLVYTHLFYFLVMKRSIVIRHADQGDSPIACANILPYGRQPDTIFELRFLRMDHFSRYVILDVLKV